MMNRILLSLIHVDEWK